MDFFDLDCQHGHDGDQQDHHGIGPDGDTQDGRAQGNGPDHVLLTHKANGPLGDADWRLRSSPARFPWRSPRKITMATLLMVPEKAAVDRALDVLPRVSSGQWPEPTPTDQDSDGGVDLALGDQHDHQDDRQIANTISTYDVDISQTPFCIFQISMLKSNLYAKRIVLRRFSFCVSIFLVCPAWSFHADFPFYVHIQ